MKSLSDKSEDIFKTEFEPLIIAIQYDFNVSQGKFITEEEAFQRAIMMHIYALSKGKKIKIDIETKLVTME